ncbi:MAG TPA: hypothetical protein DHW22_06370 [Planctomycetaceae bacterium]|nr:hypothetical protein [Planctomycetaceae bacterium]
MRDDNGAMLCHPGLGENPSLLEIFPGRKILMNEHDSAPIVGIGRDADCYDALTSDRPYKDPIPHSEVREWIATRYGTQFDPAVVEASFARGEDFLRVNQSYTRATKDACPMVPAPDCELDTEQVSLFLNC